MEEKNLKKSVSSLFSEFRNFAFKEATLGVAIGIMLGTAIKGVIDSLVNDILTPPIAKITSGIDFADLYVTWVQRNLILLRQHRRLVLLF
ncbi:MAG: MscL family protein [Candidatus Dojkabacteria bacterium]